jgi:polyhydroxybutyrate depolymerase
LQFLSAYPDGTIDGFGNRFWNATPACCDIFATGVDDSGYLSGVIDSIAARYTVDPKRVYVMGPSNGGFMSYRMACEHADQTAAIASLAGAMFDDISSCTLAEPVSVFEIHGTADGTINYNGGSILSHPYPSAPTSVADWVSLDGCDNSPDLSRPPLDMVTTRAGAETDVTRYEAGCSSGTGIELWTMNGGSHVPGFTTVCAPAVIDFLLAHPKP